MPQPIEPKLRLSAPPAEMGFAYAYPFLLLSEGSLEGLNRRLAEPLAGLEMKDGCS